MSTDPTGPTVWTLESLLEAEASGSELDLLLFWGHTPPADGSIGPHVLSQWFDLPFEAAGATYRTAEHYMMAAKARLFGDPERLADILAAETPGEAKAQGRKVRGFDEQIWARHRYDVVVEGSIAKFSSDERLRSYLVGTEDRVLVEASPHDRIWGIGLGRDDPEAVVPSRWRGLNLLGFALMLARSRLAR